MRSKGYRFNFSTCNCSGAYRSFQRLIYFVALYKLDKIIYPSYRSSLSCKGQVSLSPRQSTSMCRLVQARHFGRSKYCVTLLYCTLIGVALTILYFSNLIFDQNYITRSITVFANKPAFAAHKIKIFHENTTGDSSSSTKFGDRNQVFSPLGLTDRTTEPVFSVTELNSSFTFRIRFINDGRCIGISNTKEPVVKFCDPRQNDDFLFVDGKIRSEKLNSCIGFNQHNSSLLVFLNCTEAINFEHTGARLIHTVKSSGVKKCISAYSYSANESKWKILSHNDLGARVGLTKAGCLQKSGKVELLEEAVFLKDRAALMLPLPESSESSCNFSACGINKPVPPVITMPISQIDRCLNLSQCVTIVTKTARRPLYVIRLAKSLRKRLNMDLPMVVIDDDGTEAYNSAVMNEIAKFPKMKYVISSPDFGIAAGRTMGLQMVKTRYFMILDDDMVATENTDIARLVEILDSTDATLVGGGSNFAGFLKFGRSKGGDPTLFHYQRSCTLAHQVIPDFPGCFRCEITANIFVARTNDALSVGGWSTELKIVEHKDFFLRLKAAGKKVVYCPDFKASNVHSNVGVEFVGGLTKVFNAVAYKEKRVLRAQAMMDRFCNRWNIFQIKLIKNIIPNWI